MASYTYTVNTKYKNSQIASESRSSAPTITYNGSTIQSGFTGTKRILCANSYANTNIVVGGKTLYCGGTLLESDIEVTSSASLNPQNLFYNGNTYSSVTGGWAKYPSGINKDYRVGTPTISTNITCEHHSAAMTSISVCTGSKVNFSGYNHLNVSASWTPHSGTETATRFYLRSTNTGYYGTNVVASWGFNDTYPGSGFKTYSLNLSSYQGSYYILLAMHTWGALVINKVWLS